MYLSSLEEPIYEDGAGRRRDSTAWIRILKFNRKLKHCVAQYAYQIDPVLILLTTKAFKISGVSDILYLNEIHSDEEGILGRLPSDIRVFCDAKAVGYFNKLITIQPVKPLTKRLLSI
jgi:hypothetical protein